MLRSSTAARAFPDELEELERITDGDLRDAIKAIRSDDETTLTRITATFDAIASFTQEHCS